MCSDEDHCLDLLESQAGGCTKHDSIEIKEHCDHLGPNSEDSSNINNLHNKNSVSRHDHDHHNHQHQHCVMSDGMCHSNAVANHACNSLRKREVGACCKSFRMECCGSSQGHVGPTFGGLTDIVTE